MDIKTVEMNKTIVQMDIKIVQMDEKNSSNGQKIVQKYT